MILLKSIVGLAVLESGRTTSALVGVSPVISEGVYTTPEQLNTISSMEKLFNHHVNDLLMKGIKPKALWFQKESKSLNQYLLVEYFDHPGWDGLALKRTKFCDSPPEMENHQVVELYSSTATVKASVVMGPITTETEWVMPIPFKIRNGNGAAISIEEKQRKIIRAFLCDSEKYIVNKKLKHKDGSCLIEAGAIHNYVMGEVTTMYYLP